MSANNNRNVADWKLISSSSNLQASSNSHRTKSGQTITKFESSDYIINPRAIQLGHAADVKKSIKI